MLFTGMNVINEARNLLEEFKATNGMTDSELAAYNMGVGNALNTVMALIEGDDHIVVHLKGHHYIEELDLDELIEIVAEKEGY